MLPRFSTTKTAAEKKRVLYEGTSTIYEGMPLCYNYDTTDNIDGYDNTDGAGTTTDEGHQNEGKYNRVEDPSDDNIEFFAGVVAGTDKHGVTGDGATWLDIYAPNDAIVPVRTDANCTVGTTKLYLEGADLELGSIGAEVGNASKLVAIAMETVDRSSTAGVVLARLFMPNPIEHYDISSASGRGPSEDLWQDCPWQEIKNDLGHGFYYETDFMGPLDPTDACGWEVTQATSGALDSVIGVGGELHATAGAATADQGVNAQLLNCCVKPAAGKTIWFETRAQFSNLDPNQYFVGIASTDTTLIAGGELDETNPSSIGFFQDVNSDADNIGCITQKAGSNETTENVAEISEATWVKLGFRVNGVSSVQFYVDGELVETSSDTDDIADGVEMCLSLVCQNEDGSNTNTLKLDWVRIAQLV